MGEWGLKWLGGPNLHENEEIRQKHKNTICMYLVHLYGGQIKNTKINK